MPYLLASLIWTAPLSRIVSYGFLIAAVPLLAFVALDMRRASRASAEKKKDSLKFMSSYRDEHGMPIFFEAGEDPSARAAHRVLTQKRRSGTAN